VWCWGLDDHGQVGDGPDADVCTGPAGDAPCRTTPVQVAGLTAVTQVAAGSAYTCAVYNELLNCWGANESGQLGNDSNLDEPSPVAVPILRVQRVATADTHTCAVSTDGKLQCWGANDLGQLGDGTYMSSLRPVEVVDSTDVP
jgi:alpha-tubulin suppressor-like RCC1 family protein